MVCSNISKKHRSNEDSSIKQVSVYDSGNFYIAINRMSGINVPAQGLFEKIRQEAHHSKYILCRLCIK